MVPSFCRKSASWLLWQRRSRKQKSVCLWFPRLIQIICSLLPKHSKISLRFDLEQKKVLGEVTHSLSILRESTAKIVFDSAGLTIQKVTVNKASVKFETTEQKLIISLPAAAKPGDKFDITIRYEGKPRKGMFFILPDKDYPDRPSQVWTQGESEDTHYYLPTYDYPNDRLTTETILTVPASWITVSNGK